MTKEVFYGYLESLEVNCTFIKQPIVAHKLKSFISSSLTNYLPHEKNKNSTMDADYWEYFLL